MLTSFFIFLLLLFGIYILYKISISYCIDEECESKKYENELKSLAREALSEIDKMKPPIIQFCSPISTGGFGSVIDNLNYISTFIKECSKHNISVFNQISYEKRLDDILKDHHEYDYPLLDFFYKPILTSGKIHGLIFLPLWQTSIGSKWEHDLGLSIGIPICYLEKMLFDEIKIFYKNINI